MYIMNFNILSKAIKMTTSGASLMLVYNIRINACIYISKNVQVFCCFLFLTLSFSKNWFISNCGYACNITIISIENGICMPSSNSK